MVDFTKPVNNAQMVKHLNVLIRFNLDVVAYYERELESRIAEIQFLNKLKNLHKKHADLIADTVRLLGGAPGSGGDNPYWLGMRTHWFYKLLPGGAMDEVTRAEDRLQRRYLKALREPAVRASLECVEVINQALEESRQAMQMFEEQSERV